MAKTEGKGQTMTDGQYRALIAYLKYWPRVHRQFNLDHAMRDIGITDSRAEVIDHWPRRAMR